MENNLKQVRKVARCISTLCEVEGLDISPTDIMDVIKDSDLSNIQSLKERVVNDMRDKKETQATTNNRRQTLEAFIIKNWTDISSNDVVKDALFNSYTQGRISKVDREKMKNELLVKVGVEPQVEVQQQEETVTEDLASAMTEENF